ncbi:MAG: sugar phosphate isomerase/epimerase [Clostridia bacterium]|nr:sugar phosphate isomerase/epimerase [Clostridia bacterium]
MKLSTTTSDFSKYCATTEEKIDHLYKAGFRYIDMSLYTPAKTPVLFADETWEQEAKRLRAYAEGKGMKFVISHGPGDINPFEGDEEELVRTTKRAIEICAAMGIPATVIHGGWLPGLTQEQFYDRTEAFFNRLLPTAERCGVNLLIENGTHGSFPDWAFFYTGEQMRYFIDRMNHPLLHACWDTGHANNEGAQYENIMALGEHLYALHVNDNFGRTDDHTLPYCGTLNMDDLMCALLDVGYKGYFNFEAVNVLPSPNHHRYPRRKFERDTRLLHSTLEMQDRVESLLYLIGEHCLRAYGCFEE